MLQVTTSFRVGKGIGIVYDSTLALFEPMNGALAESLWDLLTKGAGIDELLEDLSSTGLRSLGSFAMAQFEDTQTRIVVRGTARARVEGAAGVREIAALGVRTWVEEVVDGVEGVELSLAETKSEDLPFRVAHGLIPADVLRHGVGSAPQLQDVQLDWVDEFRADEALIAPKPVAQASEPSPSTAFVALLTAGGVGDRARRNSPPMQQFFRESKVQLPVAGSASPRREVYDQTVETGSAVSRSPKGNGRSPR